MFAADIFHRVAGKTPSVMGTVDEASNVGVPSTTWRRSYLVSASDSVVVEQPAYCVARVAVRSVVR